jgi:serine/threonine protein kinase
VSTPNDPTISRDSLDGIIAAYMLAIEAGNVPNRQELLDHHPDHADALRAFFADVDRMDRVASPLRVAGGLDETGTLDTNGHTALPTVRYFGDYELLEEIARGGMGIVYKARQVSLNRIVALKMILAGSFASSREVQRFRLEAEAAANLDHPHIVPIYEVGDHEGQQYYAMKFVEVSSLAKHTRGDLRREVAGLVDVARAVHHAHQRGLLHRDMKPSNVLVDSQGTLLVTDFGLAKRLAAGDRSFTETGHVLGTPKYMAPEQAAGRKDLTVAADVYSLGVILYERLTGRTPFTGDNALAILRQVGESEPPRPSTFRRGLDGDLETVVLKCLEKEPSRRYRSAEALADDLANWLAGRPISARPMGQFRRAWRWCRRNPAVAGLTTAVAASLLVGTISSLSFAIAEHSQRLRVDRLLLDLRHNLNDAQVDRALSLCREGEIDRGLLELARVYKAALEDLRGEDLRWCIEANMTAWTQEVRLIYPPIQHEGKITASRFNPEKSVLSTACSNGTISLWEVPTGRLLARRQSPEFPIDYLEFSPDGNTLLPVAKEDDPRKQTKPETFKCRPWRCPNLEPVGASSSLPIRCSAYARFSPRGSYFATVATIKQGRSRNAPTEAWLILWDAVTCEECLRIPVLSAYDEIAWAADEKSLISASSLAMFDVPGGHLQAKIPSSPPFGRKGYVGSSEIISTYVDAFAIISPGEGAIRFLDSHSGRSVAGLKEIRNELIGDMDWVAYSPTGRFVVASRMSSSWNSKDQTSGASLPSQTIFRRKDGRLVLTLKDECIEGWVRGDHCLITSRGRVYDVDAGGLIKSEDGRAYHSLVETLTGGRLFSDLGTGLRDARTGKRVGPAEGFNLTTHGIGDRRKDLIPSRLGMWIWVEDKVYTTSAARILRGFISHDESVNDAEVIQLWAEVVSR